MRPITKRSVACLVTALFLVSAIPSGVAAEEPAEHYAFGIEYDWSYLDDDATALSGISIKDVLLDISKAADDSGFELLLAQETTGTSSIILDQYVGADTTYTFGGADVPATPHYTQLTVRHGLMADAAIMTEWHDSSASWDVTFTADSENILVMDILYVEYRNADNKMMGAAIDQSMTFTQGLELGLIGTITSEAFTDEDSGEQHAAASLPLDVSIGVGMTYEIVSSHADLLLGEASDLPNALKALNAGEALEWECSTDIESSESSTETETYTEWDEDDEQIEVSEVITRIKDPCESVTGDFSTKTSLNIQVSGLPAEELGFPAGDWDVNIIDSITDSGTYDKDDFRHGGHFSLEDGSAQTLTIDGESMEVLQADASPFPFGFELLMDNSMEAAIEGSDDGMTIADMLTDTILQEVGDEWASNLAETNDDGNMNNEYYDRVIFTCDDGEELTEWLRDGDNYYDRVNNGYPECSDNSDEGRERVKVNFNWHEWEDSPTTYIDLENYADDDDDPAKDMENAHIAFSMNYADTSITNNTNSNDYFFTIEGSYEQLELRDLWPEYDYSSMYPEGIGGDICLTVRLFAEDNTLVATGTDCAWVGDHPPTIDHIDFESEGSDSFTGDIRVWELQQDADYEINWQMKKSDGTSVDAGSFVASESYNFEAYADEDRCDENDDGIDDSDCNILSGDLNGWGEYCMTVDVNLVGGNDNPLATRERCNDIQQEPEPSQKLIDLAMAFEQSTLENVMDSFEQNLDNRLEKYEEDFAYDDGEIYTLWSKAEGKVVGIQILAQHADSGNLYTLVGPESNIYPAAPVPIHVVYFSGTAAIAQEAEIVDDTTLETLVDLTKHNTAAVDAVAAGQDPSGVDTSDGANDGTDDIIKAAGDEGLLPFISPVATLAMIAFAGMFVAVRRKD